MRNDWNHRDWARDQLADADFGNRLRVDRATRMLERAAQRPAGRLTEVFEDAAELEGGYKFIEGSVAPEAIVESFASATLRGGEGAFVYVVVDGTSLALTDRGKNKDFGSVGKREFPTRGIKVISAIGLDPDGTPAGLLALTPWARGAENELSKRARRRSGDTETKYWVEVIDAVAARAARASVVPWFVVDREGDAAPILRAVAASGGHFTIRVSQKERRCVAGARGGSLRQAISRRPVLGHHFVDLPTTAKRRGRTSRFEIRTGSVRLQLHNHGADRGELAVNVVWVRETRAPRGEERVEWMLLTNRAVASLPEAIEVVESYCHRWRIEDFHRTWKRGHCRVEETQLRRFDNVVRWATMLAAVALRVERLRHLQRTTPDEPATVAFSELEIAALRSAKRTRFTKRTEVITDEMPSVATAVRWVAQFGGFQGRGSVTPGATTIARGLERLRDYAAGYAHALKHPGKVG